MNAFLESSTEATPDHDEGHQTKLVNQKQWELGYLKVTTKFQSSTSNAFPI